MGSWPSHFPSDVPPAEAVDANGLAYRLVDAVPPKPADFLSLFEEKPTGTYKGTARALVHGVSFHGALKDSRRTRQRFKPLRGKVVARGTLKPSLGKMKATPAAHAKSHMTVWFLANAQPHAEAWQQVP